MSRLKMQSIHPSREKSEYSYFGFGETRFSQLPVRAVVDLAGQEMNKGGVTR